jgi:uncharacterized protein YndB with AHSA1/START domain
VEPLRVEFTVACSPEHAFDVWATKTTQWWPREHSISGEPGLSVTFEPRAGGRIYERTGLGAERDWGEVLIWEPPRRLSYLWHIYGDRREATEVDITFSPAGDATRVSIEHRGWEQLGATGKDLRERNSRARLIPHFERACLGAAP